MTFPVNIMMSTKTPSTQLSQWSASSSFYPVALLRQPHLTLLVSLHLEVGFQLGLREIEKDKKMDKVEDRYDQDDQNEDFDNDEESAPSAAIFAPPLR